MKKVKMQLDDLRVKSFVTHLENNGIYTVKGGKAPKDEDDVSIIGDSDLNNCGSDIACSIGVICRDTGSTTVLG